VKLTEAQQRALTGHHVSLGPEPRFWAGRDQKVNARTVDSLEKLGLVTVVFAGGPPSYPRSLMDVHLTDEGVRVRKELLDAASH